MKDSLFQNGKKFISSKQAALITGYANDYVGQLCRGKKVESILIGRNWYVSEEAIIDHKKNFQAQSSRYLSKEKIKNIREKSKISHLEPLVKLEKPKTLSTQSPKKISNLSYIFESQDLFPKLDKNLRGREKTLLEKASSRKAIKVEKIYSPIPFYATTALALILLFVVGFKTAPIVNRALLSIKERGGIDYELKYQTAASFFTDKMGEVSSSFSGFINRTGNHLSDNIIEWVKNEFQALGVLPVGKVQTGEKSTKVSEVLVVNSDKSTLSPRSQTTILSSSDRPYIDQQISELKNYFNITLSGSLSQKVDRSFLSQQSDSIVSLIGSGGGSSSSGSGISLTDLSGSSPISYNSSSGAFSFDFSTANSWTGLNQFNNASSTILSAYSVYFGGTATSSFNSAGVLTLIGQTGCLQADGSGVVSGIGSNCGSGTGSGTWSTTTSSVSGQFINYPNETDDIVVIGSNSTTTAEFWFDPNTPQSYFSGRLGLGTTSPWGQLSVNPNALGSGVPEFVIGSSSATHFVVTGAGNVGIGTSTPGSLFSVQGSGSNLFTVNSSANVILSGSITHPTSLVLNGGNHSITVTNGTGVIVDATGPFLTGGSSNRVALPSAGFFSWGSTSSGTQDTTISRLSAGKIAIGGANATGGTNGTLVASTTGLGTTSPAWSLQVATSSANGGFMPQLTLTDMSGTTDQKHWNLSSLGGNFYLGTSTDLYATSTLAALTITANGLVGVATTSPAGGFAVATHCVTGDTKLRRRRKRKGNSSPDITPPTPSYLKRGEDPDYEYDQVMIKDVKAGDEIQSLDERTGKLVWSKVNKLMYMGEKEIFKLTTASGKTIRTTSEHPYLVLPENKIQNKNFKKESKYQVGVFVDSSNIYHAYKKAKWQIDVIKLGNLLKYAFAVITANFYVAIPRIGDPTRDGMISYAKIAEKLFNVKDKPLKYIFDDESKREVKKGDVDVELVLDVVEHLDSIDAVIVVSGDSDYLALREYARKHGKPIVFMSYKDSMAWELRLGDHLFVEQIRSLVERKAGFVENQNPDLSAGAALMEFIVAKAIEESRGNVDKNESGVATRTTPTYRATDAFDGSIAGVPTSYQNTIPFVKGGVWKKVKAVREGEYIAITSENNEAKYDKIVKIEKLPAEDVYDIEVEGTHNFVGNDIIAHNTYLGGGLGVGLQNTTAGTITTSGSIGIATSSPFAQLSVNSEAGLTPFVIGSSTATSFIVDRLGNVGIGTSSPAYALGISPTSGVIAGQTAFIYDATPTTGRTSLTLKVGADNSAANTNGILRIVNNSGTFLSAFDQAGDLSFGSTARPFLGSAGLSLGSGDYIHLANNSPFIWSATTDGQGTADLGIYRNAPGLLEVNNGTAGALASLIARNIGIGTTTPGTSTPSVAMLQISSSTASTGFRPQLALSDQGAGTDLKHWTLSSQGGNLYFATATDVYATSTLAALTITANGLVGVATTSPAGGFAVGTHCVTGDTLLKIRRRRKKQYTDSEGEEFEIDEYDSLFIPIKDVLPGDEVLSLNQETGEFEYHKIKGLLDTGIRTVYRLMTESGRYIETTGNHPYLVRERIGEKSHHISGKYRVGVFIDSSNLYHAAKKAKWHIGLSNLKNLLTKAFDVVSATCYIVMPQEGDETRKGMITYANVAKQFFSVKEKPLKYIYDPVTRQKIKKGDIDIDLSMDVIRTLENVDAIIIMSGDSDYLALAKYAKERGVPVVFMSYKDAMAWEHRISNHIFLEHIRNYIDRTNQNPDLSAGAVLTQSIVAKALGLSSSSVDSSLDNKFSKESILKWALNKAGIEIKRNSPTVIDSWVKTSDLRESQEIAVIETHTDDLDEGKMWSLENELAFEKILKIEKLEEKQVYDIEVEGTHNFVAGHLRYKKSGKILSLQEEQKLLKEYNNNLSSFEFDYGIGESDDDNIEFAGLVAHNTYLGGGLGVGLQNTTAGTITTSGSIGIATSSPFAQLSVNSEAGLTPFVIGSSTATSFIVDSSGRVGIGTANPTNALQYNVGVSTLFSVTTGTGAVNTTNSYVVSTSAFYGGTSAILRNNYVIQWSPTSSYLGGADLGLARNAPGLLEVNTGTAGALASLIARNIGIGTTTPGTSTPSVAMLQISSTTAATGFRPQLAISDQGAGTNQKHWTFASEGGYLYISTSTDLYATTSISALEISGTGFGTTTVRGLTISGQATSTSNVGFSITNGCYAIGSTCVGSGSSFTGAINSIVTTDNSGALIATTSQLTVGSLISTTTTSSFFVGSIGIGTTTPQWRLQVASTTMPQLALQGGDSDNPWTFRSIGNNLYIGTSSPTTYATTTGITALTILNNGNVGIGTSTPTATLGVEKTTAASGESVFRVAAGVAGSGTANLNFSNTAGGGVLALSAAANTISSVGALVISAASPGIVISPGTIGANSTGISLGNSTAVTPTSGTANAIVTSFLLTPSSGSSVLNVFNLNPSIGQTGNSSGISRGFYLNPTVSAAFDFRALETAPYSYTLARSTTTLQSVLQNALTFASTTAATLINASQERITGAPIASTNVTISTSTGLIIEGGAVNGGGTVTTAYGLQVFAPTGATNNYAASFIGNVGVGTSTPWRTLSITGTVAIDGLNTSTAGNAVCILAGGEVVTAGGTTCTTSALKTKTDIVDITSEQALKVLLLKPSEFTNIEGGDRRFGFIADWTESVDPKLVEYSKTDNSLFKKGEISGFDYLRFPALLTKLVQDMYAQMQNILTIVNPMLAWFGDNKFNVEGDVCVDDVCITKGQFKEMILRSGVGAVEVISGGGSTPTPEPTPTPTPTPEPTSTSTPPVIDTSPSGGVPESSPTTGEEVPELVPDSALPASSGQEPSLQTEPEPLTESPAPSPEG